MRGIVQKFHNFCLKSWQLPSTSSRKRSDQVFVPEKSPENGSSNIQSVDDKSAPNKLELVRQEFELLKFLVPDDAPIQLNENLTGRLCEEPLVKNRILYMMKYHRRLQAKEELKRLRKEKNKVDLPAFIERIQQQQQQQIISYNSYDNTIFRRFLSRYMRKMSESRCLAAFTMDRPVVCFGFSFMDSLLPPGPMHRLVKELEQAIRVNQSHRTPCKLVLTNFGKSAPCWSKFGRIPELELNEEKNEVVLSVETTEKSILELYPDRKMIYLSPRSPKPLMNFDEDIVYILGGLPTREGNDAASLDRAAALGIQTRCLPIDVYFQSWPSLIRRSLPLDQCLGILLDYYHHQDWTKAITDRAISSRKTPKPKTDDDTGDILYSKKYLAWLESEFNSYFGS